MAIDFTAPLNNALANLVDSYRSGYLVRRQNEQDAFSRQQQMQENALRGEELGMRREERQARLADLLRQQGQETNLQAAMTRFATGRPIMERQVQVPFAPRNVQVGVEPYKREEVIRGLAPFLGPDKFLELTKPQDPKDPYEGLPGEIRARIRGTKDPLVAEAIRAEEAAKDRRKPQTVINNVLGLGDLAKEQGKDLISRRGDVLAAANSIENLTEAKSLIKQGIITGTGSAALTEAGNFLSSRLGFNVGKDAVANTQAYAGLMGREVGNVIRLFGSGTGLSDADREYAMQIAAGRTSMTQEALEKLIDINIKINRAKIKNYNKEVEPLANNPEIAGQLLYDLRVPYEEEAAPTAAPASGGWSIKRKP